MFHSVFYTLFPSLPSPLVFISPGRVHHSPSWDWALTSSESGPRGGWDLGLDKCEVRRNGE